MVKTQYFYAVGKRKTAIARVKLIENGSGDITVNDSPLKKYFLGPVQREKVLSPLELINHKGTFDVAIQVVGGGKESQSEAARHGIARALLNFDPELRTQLKRAGYLRRDARVHERKKPGLKRARRAPQWAKR